MTPMAPTRPIRPPNPTTTAAATSSTAANGAARAFASAASSGWRRGCPPWRPPGPRSRRRSAPGRVRVDPDVAILLTSELVTNAVTHATARSRRNGRAARRGFAAEAVLLVIAADDAGLRVDVHDGSGDLPVLADCPAEADAETGRGLLLVTSLSAEWGFYRTPGGKAVYFTLEAQPDVHGNVIDAPGWA